MKLCAFALLTVAAADLALGGESEAGATGPRAEWRQAVLPAYQFTPRPQDHSPIDSVRAPPPPSPGDQNVVKMAPVVVHDSVIALRGLHETVARNEADANATDLAAKFGTGFHEHRGKRITVGVETILFIPVAFGFKW